MKIILIGYGAMGKRLENIISNSHHELVGIITSQNISNKKNYKECKVSDVMIDFSHPSILPETLAHALETKTPLVVATTGISEENMASLKLASLHIPILITTNTSFGIATLLKLISISTPILKDWDIEIIEKHHNKKLDSPSGTAKSMLETIEKNSGFAHEKLFGRSGLKKRVDKEIAVHSIRGGTIVGEHSVLFCGPEEIIELKHSALSKDIFAHGAIKMAQLLIEKSEGLYTSQDLLII